MHFVVNLWSKCKCSRFIIAGFLVFMILYYVSLTFVPNYSFIIAANIFALFSSIFFSYSFVLFLDSNPIIDVSNVLFILILASSVFVSLVVFENFENKNKLATIIICIIFLLWITDFMKETAGYILKLIDMLSGLL